jgi:hypothetical protein
MPPKSAEASSGDRDTMGTMSLYVGHFDFTVPLLWTAPSLFSVEECARILDAARDGA